MLMKSAVNVAAGADSATADRARLVLIIIGVLVGLAILIFAFHIAGEVIHALGIGLARFGPLLVAACLLSAACAFIFAIDWLWIVTVATGILYGIRFMAAQASVDGD